MALSTMRIAKVHETGDSWLADCSTRSDLVRQEWEAEALAPITTQALARGRGTARRHDRRHAADRDAPARPDPG
ncbi:hypothetical protein [Streptomyces sp. NBC_00286]|uniref:hypothetical protein n=1 Tax=Streptomyces sp. NBC_00286 TaxID=2975701 RepID=UPI002E2B32CF|nr:hypothetical protein [Streptomyces sp. NBC_00286]